MNFSSIKLFFSNHFEPEYLVIGLALVIIFVISSMIFLKPEKHLWYKHGASIITTLGIFFTFMGITVGLVRFNPEDQQSLHQLISGLKLAFIPSTVAVLISIFFKWKSPAHASNPVKELSNKITDNTKTIDKLILALSNVDLQIDFRKNLERNIEHTTRLETILDVNLTELVSALGERKEQFDLNYTALAEIIANSKETLSKVSNDLHITTERLNSRFKGLFETATQQNNHFQSLQEIYQRFDSCISTINEFEHLDSLIVNNVRSCLQQELQRLEESITKNLSLQFQK